jgi:hypothetical protein
MTTDNFCFYLQSRLFQTSQTGGQWYNDTSPFSIPCLLLQDEGEGSRNLVVVTEQLLNECPGDNLIKLLQL